MPPILQSERRGAPTGGDAAVEALLDGRLAPEDTAAELRPAAQTIAALTAAPAPSELAGEQAARTAYRAGFGQPAPSLPPRRRHRRHRRAWLLRARLAAVAAAVLTLGGVAAAAYAGVLPAPMQTAAHDLLAAPAARPGLQPARPGHPAPSTIPAGRGSVGRGAHGLCTTYTELKAHGSIRREAAAFRNLAAAAGGPTRVTAYCAGDARPRKAPPSQKASRAAGKPPAMPAHIPPGHAGAAPATHPGHGPATHPAMAQPPTREASQPVTLTASQHFPGSAVPTFRGRRLPASLPARPWRPAPDPGRPVMNQQWPSLPEIGRHPLTSRASCCRCPSQQFL